jgi:hypothetical protein
MKLLIPLIFITQLASANFLDSLKAIKPKKYYLETGGNSAIFLSLKVNNNLYNEFLQYPPFVTNIGFSCQRNHKYKTSYSISIYDIYFKNKEIKGEVMNITFANLSFGIQKRVFQKKRFQYFEYGCLNWMIGYETIFINRYYWETNRHSSFYNSFGIGIGNGFNYRMGERFNIGLDIGYYHYFERPRLQYPQDYPSYKPVRDLIVTNLKIGFRL